MPYTHATTSMFSRNRLPLKDITNMEERVEIGEKAKKEEGDDGHDERVKGSASDENEMKSEYSSPRTPDQKILKSSTRDIRSNSPKVSKENRPSLHPTSTDTVPSEDSRDRDPDISITSSESSGLGFGSMKSSAEILKSRRTSASRPPIHQHNQHKARLPSWHANSKAPEGIIVQSIRKILAFTRDVAKEESPVKSDSLNFKMFVEANKEIVEAWWQLGKGELKSNVGLGEKVDCIHAILEGWKGEDVMSANWVMQAVELTNLDAEFAKEWEVVTGVKIEELEPTEKSKEALTKEKEKETVDIFTSQDGLTDTADEESDETMDYIQPLPLLARDVREGQASEDTGDDDLPFTPTRSPRSDRCSSTGSNSSGISNDSNVISSVILREHFRYCPSAPAPNQATLDEAFQFHERLERIENSLYQQSELRNREDLQALQKIDSLKDLITQQSDNRATSINQRLEKIEGLIERSTTQTLEKIKTTLEAQLASIDHTLQQKSGSQLASANLQDLLDQHFSKVENSFEKQCDSLREGVDRLFAQQSRDATSFLNQLTQLNSAPRLDRIENLLGEAVEKKSSITNLEHHINQHYSGTSITDKGAMIQSIHTAIVRVWDALKVEQKRSAVTILKRFISDWHKTYATAMSPSRGSHSKTHGSFSCETQSSESHTTQFKEFVEKMKHEIDNIEDHISALNEVVVLEEKLEEKVVLLENAKQELLESKMNSHWVYTAFDEAADICWPQGDPDVAYAETSTESDESDGEENGIQCGGRGGSGSGGACAIM